MDVLKVIIICITASLLFATGSCDKSTKGSMLQWSCLCSSSVPYLSNFTTLSGCSTSCDCKPGPELNGVGLTCNCLSPTSQFSRQSENCFASCNCTSDPLNTSISTKRHVSNKLVLTILLLCIVLTTIAFVVSAACYFYRKDKISNRALVASSERNASWNSEANLLSYPSRAMQDVQVKIVNGNPVAEFIGKTFCIFKKNHQCLSSFTMRFSYLDLEHATEKFSNGNLIGLGGSSSVYRGVLKDGRVVAVKRLNLSKISDADSSFPSEIGLISRLHHIHVVSFLGYCSEIRGRLLERLLVFEYMPNGNLRDCLDATKQGQMVLDWATRVSIALGAAKGLEYLHEAAAPSILHRDIKSTNILLDEKYRSKITDLGMAKQMTTDDPANYTSSPARMMGTFGYFAPECAVVGRASIKSDVFSFGVVILELITGRRPIQKSSSKADESLVIWALPKLSDAKLVILQLPDPLLKRDFPEEEMQIMAELARECLQWDPDCRPTMSEVVQVLATMSAERRNFPIGFYLKNSSQSLENSCRKVGHDDISECGSRRIDFDQSKLVQVQDTDRESRLNSSKKTLSYQRMAIQNTLELNGSEWQSVDVELVAHGDITGTLASNTSNRLTCDEELVDLVEPRFESFLQTNSKVV